MHKKDKFVELTKIYNCNDVHNESLEKKKSKKKIDGQRSTELKTYTEENTCEKDIEQNISQERKPEINVLADVSPVNKCSIDNDHIATKKPKKKKNHNKSLNSIEINSNNGEHYRTYEKDNDHNINDSDFTEKKMSELNALATKKPKKNKKHNKSLDMNSDINEVEFKSFERTSVEVGEQNINDSDSRENVKKLSSKKIYIKSLNLIELNSINDAETKPFERTCKEVNGQNIIDSYSRKNVNRKRKSELNGPVDISLSDNYSIDNENVPTKKTKKEKNHNGSLNSTELNKKHDTEIQTFERTYEEVNDSRNSHNVIQTMRTELNESSDMSLKIQCSMNKNNAITKKSKKEKKHNKSLNSLELNTNIDAYFKTYEKNNELNINGSDSKENNVIQKRMFDVNTLTDMGNDCINYSENIPTKKKKKKKNHDKSINMIELNTINDADCYTYEKNNEQKINTLAHISLGNYCNNYIENIPTKNHKKKKNHNKSLNPKNISTNHDTEIKTFERTCKEVSEPNMNDSITKELSFASLEISSSLVNENIATKKRKKYKKNINPIELNTINEADCQTYEKNNEQEINDLPTKKPKKKKNHNKSLNSTELDTNHDKEIQMLQKPYEEVNDSDYRENVNQKIKSKLNTSTDILLENKCSIDIDNAATKKPKKKKNHNKNLNSTELDTNHDKEIQMLQKTYEEVNDSDYRENVNQKIKSKLNTSTDILLENKCSIDIDNAATKKPKKKKNHNKSLNSTELDTNHDKEIQMLQKAYEEVNDSDYRENVNQKIKSKLNTSTDILLENKCSIDIDNAATKKPKKKKNHNKSLNSTELDTNHDKEIQMLQKTYEEVNDSDYRENVNQKIKSKLNTSTDILLENKCSIDIDNAATKKRNKKKKHNKCLSSIELNTNNDTYFRTYEKNNELNVNCFDSKGDIIQKRMSEMNTLADVSLENDCNNDTENILTEKHGTNLNINTKNDTEFKTFERTCKEVSEPNMNGSDTKELSAQLEISYGLDSENIATKESKKRKKHNILKTVISDCTDENKMLFQPNLTFPMISQNQCELKSLLNSMEKYNFEESSTINKTNFNLKRFNLIKYLTIQDPSLKNHPNFRQINEYLSKKIKQTINTKCEVGASDILLLKTVGKIILKKIIEKINSAQGIKDLVIELPPECRENKIHFMETTLSRLPNKLKMDIIKEHNPLIKLRVFNKDEDKMIREYWSKFQKEYNISNILPFLSNGLEMALSPKERLQFIRYISAGLPNRLLYSVFNRFNILFNEYQDKTSFSEEEDQLIIKVDKCDAIKNKFSVLSLILNRTRLQLYRRIEVLRNQHEECKKIIWDDQMRQELFTNILLETNTEHWKHLKNLTITKDIWIKIAKNLGEDFTYKKVRYQWNYLYTMLFCEKPILTSTFNLTTLELLKQINANHWSDLDWIDITNQLYPGANSKVICAFFHSWIDRKVPSNIKGNIRDALNYLQCHEVDKLKRRIDERGEREFPRLTVKHFDLLVNNQ